jgi:hypothetical protein
MEMPGFQPTYNNFINQGYHRVEEPVDANSWDQNVDPSLRNNYGVMDMNYAWNDKPIDRFMAHPEKMLFTVGHIQSFQPPFHQAFGHPYEGAMASHPYACEPTRGSPSPSGLESSICSSGLSPRTENDFPDNFFQQVFNPRPLSPSISRLGQGALQPTWAAQGSKVQGYIQMSQVQTLQDDQDFLFQEDEGYTDIEMKNECLAEVDCRTINIKPEPYSLRHYRHQSDEAIGGSIKDEEASDRGDSANVQVNQADEDLDADGDVDEDVDVDVDADADAYAEIDNGLAIRETADDSEIDGEYSPTRRPRTRTSTRKRRLPSRQSPILSSPVSKRVKVTKSHQTPKSPSPFACDSCDHTSYDAVSLAKHVATAHTRPFICTFGFAGCKGRFGSKNEWKRHVTSQHLALQYWRCSTGGCGGAGSSASTSKSNRSNSVAQINAGNEFNRKDLFTQHLRRMHAPFSVKNRNKADAKWEATVKDLQTSCLRQRRLPPMKVACPLASCGMVFDGSNCWDEKMEHVGRHLEAVAAMKAKAVDGSEVERLDQGDDHFMVEWAFSSGIIDRRLGGGWILCSMANDGEADADGDDE